MMRSLYSAISGLGVNQQAMDVLGNNISNVNTVGYKASRAVFEDLLSQTLAGSTSPTDNSAGINATQVGLGSALAGVDTVFETGTMQTTEVDTDLAIQWDGFFVLGDGSEGNYLYSRAGNFSFGADGSLTNSSGYFVQGWMVDPDTGEMLTDTNVDNIVLSSDYQTAVAKATTEVSLAGVLDTEADPTVLEYPELMHYADPGDSIFSVYSSDGGGMDLADNEAIKVKAHAAGRTDMKDVYNVSDVNLGLEDDKSLLVYVNSNAHTLTYGTDYTSLGGFTSQLENILNQEAETALSGPVTDFNVYVQNGAVRVVRDTYTADAADVAINSFSGSPILAVGLSDLAANYDDASDSKTSDEMYFESTIYAGRDFTTLSELAAAMETELDGNVISADEFSVTYDNTTGQFIYDINNTINSASGTLSISGISVDKSFSGTTFESNIVPPSASSMSVAYVDTAAPGYDPAVDGTGRVQTESDIFLRTAQDDDPLSELFTSAGVELGLDNTAIIEFSSSVGGEPISGTASIAVAGNTIQDFREAIANYYGYDSATEEDLANHIGSFTENSVKLKITGNDGKPNEIDFAKFEVVGSGDYDAFYDYFEYSTSQNASGGTLTTSQTVYDNQGASHTVQYNFEMYDSAENSWKLTLSSPDEGVDVSLNQASGSEILMHFNSNGSFNYMTTVNGTRVPELTMNIDPGTGAGVITDVAINLGTASRFDGMYMASDDGGINSASQDGYTTGTLESTLFNSAGEVIGYYTNGQVSTIAQIALATFTNPNGLMKVGDTTFQSTTNSGDPAIGEPNTGFRGEVASGTLENSNVDLSSQFVGMITTQRGFQANSKVITTSDQMLQELMTLKR